MVFKRARARRPFERIKDDENGTGGKNASCLPVHDELEQPTAPSKNPRSAVEAPEVSSCFGLAELGNPIRKDVLVIGSSLPSLSLRPVRSAGARFGSPNPEVNFATQTLQ